MCVLVFQTHVDQTDPDPPLAKHLLQCEFPPTFWNVFCMNILTKMLSDFFTEHSLTYYSKQSIDVILKLMIAPFSCLNSTVPLLMSLATFVLFLLWLVNLPLIRALWTWLDHTQTWLFLTHFSVILYFFRIKWGWNFLH